MPMRIPRNFIKYSRTEPARTITSTTAVITFLAGLWILTPWYVPLLPVGPSASVAFNFGMLGAAVINCGFCIPALRTMMRGKGNHVMIAKGAWWLFIWFVFVTMTRLVVVGFSSLFWVPSAIIAMILSIVYIEQKFLARTDVA